MKHFLTINDFSLQEIETILEEAKLIELYWDHRKCIHKPLENKCIASFFAEPSTRTRFSFERAAHWLGLQVLTAADAASSSSLTKGESIKDTFRTLGQYTNAIVVRMNSEKWPDIAREFSRIPVINAGSGSGEHPTQALLDLYTIKQKFNDLSGLKVMICGDLLNGRTTHSLIQILNLYNIEIYICPAIKKHSSWDYEPLTLPDKYLDKNIKTVKQENIKEVLPEIDVLYITRIQKERTSLNDEIKFFKLDGSNIKYVKDSAIILHPLPRNDEISEEIDDDPRADYHERQVRNGVYVRTSLLKYIFNTQQIS